MLNLYKLKCEIEKKGYHLTETIPHSGEVLVYEGRVGCAVLEMEEESSADMREILKDLGYKMMIRGKNNGITQFILKH